MAFTERANWLTVEPFEEYERIVDAVEVAPIDSLDGGEQTDCDVAQLANGVDGCEAVAGSGLFAIQEEGEDADLAEQFGAGAWGHLPPLRARSPSMSAAIGGVSLSACVSTGVRRATSPFWYVPSSGSRPSCGPSRPGASLSGTSVWPGPPLSLRRRQ